MDIWQSNVMSLLYHPKFNRLMEGKGVSIIQPECLLLVKWHLKTPYKKGVDRKYDMHKKCDTMCIECTVFKIL